MTTDAPSLPARLRLFAADIKLSHSLFALPFALLATFLAANGMPPAGILLLILLCMVTARTVAMTANRLLDAPLDALNPRTARRALPSGALSPSFMIGALTVCALAFILATSGFYHYYNNPWPLVFSIPVLAFISAYPLLKRFSRLCHYYLGAALALAPICAWIAVTGTIAPEPFLMAGAVLLWTAGFDIIYATQDYDIDRAQGLHSIPAKLGLPRALLLARITHTASVAFLIALGLISPPLHLLYFIGVALATALLITEHALVRPADLSKVNLAFFTLNGIISLILGTLGIIDVFI